MKQTLTDRIESAPTWLLVLVSGFAGILSVAIAWYQMIHVLFLLFAFLTATIIYLLLEIENKKLFFYLTIVVWVGAGILWFYAGFRSIFIWECLVGTNGTLLGSTERCQTGELYLTLLTIPAVYQAGYWVKTHIKLQSFPRKILQFCMLGLIGSVLTQIFVYGVSALALFVTVYGIIFR